MALRQAAQAAGQQLRGRAAALQLQQQRAAGNLPVKPNKYVEQWGTMREHVEDQFKWDTKTLLRIAVFAGLAPYAVYRGCVSEFNKVDDRVQRPERAMWGNDA